MWGSHVSSIFHLSLLSISGRRRGAGAPQWWASAAAASWQTAPALDFPSSLLSSWVSLMRIRSRSRMSSSFKRTNATGTGSLLLAGVGHAEPAGRGTGRSRTRAERSAPSRARAPSPLPPWPPCAWSTSPWPRGRAGVEGYARGCGA